MEQRSVIFSNGSENGFKSALFLPSEFFPENETETLIMIDALSEYQLTSARKSSLNGVSLKSEEDINFSFERMENESFQKLSAQKDSMCKNKQIKDNKNYSKQCEANSIFEFKNEYNLIQTSKLGTGLQECSRAFNKKTTKSSNGFPVLCRNNNCSNNQLPSGYCSNLRSKAQLIKYEAKAYTTPQLSYFNVQLPISMNTMVYLNLLKEKQLKSTLDQKYAHFYL